MRREPFDDPAWLFDLKLDGFRGLADTITGRMLSKNGNRLKRFEALVGTLPPGYVSTSRRSDPEKEGKYQCDHERPSSRPAARWLLATSV